MYWNSNPASSIHLESLLTKQDVTLEEIMDDAGVLQECKSKNKRLIDYLVRPDVLKKLVSLTTEEPPGDEEDTIKYKYPNIACELLTCEVPQLSESLAKDETLLRKLYSFLDSDAPLNPLLASFFSKTLSVLITRNSEQNLYSYQFTCLKVLEFLKLKENSITLLLKHLGTSAIMDLVFKLITEVEDSNIKENFLNWLDEQKLVENLVGLLDPSVDSDMHYNVAQLLCDVIRTSRMNKIQALEPNKILDRIESPETVSLLLDFILKEPKCETSIVGGISVLLTLLEDKCGSEGRYAFEESIQYNPDYLEVVASTAQAILPRLKDFHDILLNPPVKPAVKTTITVLEPPLGNTRVEVAKLLSVLVAVNVEEVNKKLAELDTINVLLDLFFKYTWNNFLHTQVQKCLAFALNSDVGGGENGEIKKNGLIAHILSKCRLIQRILDAWQDNETQQTEHKRPRRGYMGHLIEIANNIVQRAETHSFGALMKETVDNETLNKWENFVSTKLAEIYETYSTCLGVGETSSENKDGGDGKEVSFENFSQELYSNYYQLQALAPTFTDGFGSFQEGQFNDEEDVVSASANPTFLKVDFGLNEEVEKETQFMEKIFSKLPAFDDLLCNENPTTAKPGVNPERDWPALESSSSDEEDTEPIKKGLNMEKEPGSIDFNMLSSWPDETDVPPAESFNPWESSSMDAVGSPDLGWANFESAAFADFDFNLNPDINTTIATSASYNIDSAPLDLTPSENNSNIGEMFSKEGSEMEKPQVVENNPSSIVFTDLEMITKAAEKITLNSDSQSPSQQPGADSTEKTKDHSKKNPGETVVKKEEEVEDKQGTQVNCVENPEVIGDVNNLEKLKEEKESRFLPPQGLTTCTDSKPESGDNYQILKENVQVVPNESTQISCMEVGNSSSEDRSPNGPI